MCDAMKVIELDLKEGRIYDGAKIDSFRLSGVDVDINAIVVGENDRKTKRGLLPVSNSERPEKGSWSVKFASVSETRKGAPKLTSEIVNRHSNPVDKTSAIVVVRADKENTVNLIRKGKRSDGGYIPYTGEVLAKGTYQNDKGIGEEAVIIAEKDEVFTSIDKDTGEVEYFLFDGSDLNKVYEKEVEIYKIYKESFEFGHMG